MTAPSPATTHVYPNYRRSEIIADRWVHAVGFTGGLVGVAALLATVAERQDLKLAFGVGLYGVGLLAMLACSALYSMSRPSPRKESLRRLDRAAIFVMIAGSYTPFLLNRIGGGWGWSMLAFVWTVAFLGVGFVLAAPRRFERAQLAAYLLLGWSIVIAGGPLVDRVPPAAILLLIAGGLFYTLGVPFHLSRRLAYRNAIWHGLVLIAAGCHYAAVLLGVVFAA